MIQTGHEAAAVQLAEGDNAEDRDGKAADDEADTVDGIRVGNGFQAAEYRVAPEYRMVGSMVTTYAIRNRSENRRMVKVS